MNDYHVGYVNEDGEPCAVFLDSAPDCNAGNLLVYSRVGEHAEASIDYLRRVPLAEEELYGPLHRYLAARYGPGNPHDFTAFNLVVDQSRVPR